MSHIQGISEKIITANLGIDPVIKFVPVDRRADKNHFHGDCAFARRKGGRDGKTAVTIVVCLIGARGIPFSNQSAVHVNIAFLIGDPVVDPAFQRHSLIAGIKRRYKLTVSLVRSGVIGNLSDAGVTPGTCNFMEEIDRGPAISSKVWVAPAARLRTLETVVFPVLLFGSLPTLFQMFRTELESSFPVQVVTGVSGL